MAIYIKSGRSKSVFNIGSIRIGARFVEVNMTMAEIRSHVVLNDALKNGVIIVKNEKPEDEIIENPENGETGLGENASQDNNESKSLTDDLESLKEIADSYGIEYGATIQAESLKIRINDYLEEQEEED